MIPILSTTAMRRADARAVARRGVDALVRDAGLAIALVASEHLRSTYGARVAVVVGPGLNGADGRVAAEQLRRRGAHVTVIEVAEQPSALRGFDLVIDAAFGLGCSRPYRAPHVPPTTIVVAADLPSGVDADTGEVLGQPMKAHVTVALGALKPAHVTGHAAAYVGELRMFSLGIESDDSDGLLEASDLADFVRWNRTDHKWHHAVDVIAGSTMMPGAADLVTRGALAGGASMIRLATRGELGGHVAIASEVVRTDGPPDARSRAVVAGPGLGRDAVAWLATRLTDVRVPVVLDADGLDESVLAVRRGEPWVLTPHDGEYERLVGSSPSADRLDAARTLARASGCVVLLKGPTTVVAGPDGHVRVIQSGTSALATAGTGDVLAGLVGASIARGHDPFDAAALGAYVHGAAGSRLSRYARSSDLPAAIGEVLRAR